MFKSQKIFYLQEDEHEKMKVLWELQKTQEELQMKIEKLESDNKAYENLLCSPEEDLADLAESIFGEQVTNSFTANENDKIAQFFKAKDVIFLNKLFGIKVRFLNSQILIHFPPPPFDIEYKPHAEALLVFRPNEDGDIELTQFDMPGTLRNPVLDLKEKFLEGEEKNIKTFMHSVRLLLCHYWDRHFQCVKINQETFMSKRSLFLHNSSCTQITFSLFLMEQYDVEMKLKYNFDSNLPYEITYKDYKDRKLPVTVVEGMEDLKKSMFIHPLDEVLRINFADNSSLEGSSRSSDTSDTLLFNASNH